MPKFHVEIDCGNSAFGDDDLECCAELRRILFHLAINVGDGRLYVPLYDENGNRCGFADFVREG